eukprot:COSAG02_NODE_50955_length_317_cov_0.834862_1_plen_42_part_01
MAMRVNVSRRKADRQQPSKYIFEVVPAVAWNHQAWLKVFKAP